MFVTINNCRLFFDVYGSKLKITPTEVIEKPTMIVLHGGHGMVDHTLYVEFWSQFADLAQVIFIDQRGCGRSDHRTSSEWNLNHWAEDVYQFCQTLGIEKPILAGVSMGGHVMCEYVAKHPKNLGGLIFCNTEARFVLDDVCEKLAAVGGAEIAEIARQQFTNPTPESTKVYQEKCIKYYAKNAYSPTEIKRCKQHIEVLSYYSEHYIQNFDYTNDLNNITCPTLLMVGEASPFHLPIRAEEMAAHITSELVTLHLFKDAGAAVYKDSPDEAAMVVRNFLTNQLTHE